MVAQLAMIAPTSASSWKTPGKSASRVPSTATAATSATITIPVRRFSAEEGQPCGGVRPAGCAACDEESPARAYDQRGNDDRCRDVVCGTVEQAADGSCAAGAGGHDPQRSDDSRSGHHGM